MIEKFSCEDFRNVSCKELEFEKINILIGPNNSGKSNFIKALSFAANMVNGTKDEQTGFLSEMKRNGWGSVLNRRTDGSTFNLTWQFGLGKNRPVEYTLRVDSGTDERDPHICEETLVDPELKAGRNERFNYFRCHTENLGHGYFSTAGFGNSRNYRINTKLDQYESAFLQIDDLFMQKDELFTKAFLSGSVRTVLKSLREYFQGFYSYSCTALDVSAIRELRGRRDSGSYLKKDGSNFVNVYMEAAAADEGFEKTYSKMLEKMIPHFERVQIQNLGGRVWMELVVDGCAFPLSELSDGTVHLLVLLLLFALPEKNGVSLLALDEPEMDLHPAWQKQLAMEIQWCTSVNQIFISTHSPDFLDEFTEGFLEGRVGVFVFDPRGKEPIRKLDRSELAGDLKDFTLGDLYRVGDPMIGGWPM